MGVYSTSSCKEGRFASSDDGLEFVGRPPSPPSFAAGWEGIDWEGIDWDGGREKTLTASRCCFKVSTFFRHSCKGWAGSPVQTEPLENLLDSASRGLRSTHDALKNISLMRIKRTQSIRWPSLRLHPCHNSQIDPTH